MIQADKIRARDGDGLALYEDGGKGIFVKDGGDVGLGTTTPNNLLQLVGEGVKVEQSIYVYSNAAGDEPQFILSHARGTKATPTATQANDELGTIFFLGHTDVSCLSAAIRCYADTGFGATGQDSPGRLHFQTTPDNSSTLITRMTIKNSGNVGIGTDTPGNPLAVNRAADGIIVDFESADTVEGNVSIAGNTTSYNAFMGSHYTQLKDGQKVPPVGAIVIATGEIIPCEAHITVPAMERYYESRTEIPIEESIEDEIIEKQRDTGKKQTAYILVAGKVIKTKIPVLETVQILCGKKLKDEHSLDERTGKVYKKINKVLGEGEEVPENVTILERQKMKGGTPLTEIKTKEVSGIERKEYFSYVELASQKADKRVYGVYHAKMSDDAKGQSFGEDDKAVHQIAALGLYKVRVTDTNGDIAAGDYIQSSIRTGEGEHQDDDILHNYTVAKSIIDVNWNKVKVDPVLDYKWQLIPATLHAG
jgi:hypothetical protein